MKLLGFFQKSLPGGVLVGTLSRERRGWGRGWQTASSLRLVYILLNLEGAALPQHECHSLLFLVSSVNLEVIRERRLINEHLAPLCNLKILLPFLGPQTFLSSHGWDMHVTAPLRFC